MTRTKDAAALSSVETCPLCGSCDVRAREPRWFALDLDRGEELRDDVTVLFACRDCGTVWD